MATVKITVNEKSFTAKMYDNEAATAFSEMLPLTINMSELNNNEKYYYLDEPLPKNAEHPHEIRAGDLMLYGENCVVLFYKTFTPSYSYTPLGYIEDPEGLAEAVGKKSVSVTFDIR